MPTVMEIVRLPVLEEKIDNNTTKHIVAAYMKQYNPLLNAEAVSNRDFMQNVRVDVVASDGRRDGNKIVILNYSNDMVGIGFGNFRETEKFLMLDEAFTLNMCKHAASVSAKNLSSIERMKEVQPSQNVDEFLSSIVNAQVDPKTFRITTFEKKAVLTIECDNKMIATVNKTSTGKWEIKLPSNQSAGYENVADLKRDVANILWSLINPSYTNIKDSIVINDYKNNNQLKIRSHFNHQYFNAATYEGLELVDAARVSQQNRRDLSEIMERFVNKSLKITVSDLLEIPQIPLDLTVKARAKIVTAFVKGYDADTAYDMEDRISGKENLFDQIGIEAIRKDHISFNQAGESSRLLFRILHESLPVGFVQMDRALIDHTADIWIDSSTSRVIDHGLADELTTSIKQILNRTESNIPTDEDMTDFYQFKR